MTAAAEAGAWPNPAVELQVDNHIGLSTGAGGLAVSGLTLSQPLPSGRTVRMAGSAAELEARRAALTERRLQLAHRIALAYHHLQLARERWALQGLRLQSAEQRVKNGGGRVVRVYTPLERLRLNILREQALQAESTAVGEWSEAHYAFNRLAGAELRASRPCWR